MKIKQDLPNFSIEKKLKQHSIIAGLDEAGRGCLAGPVVATAVILPRTKAIQKLGINDSKKLSKAKREEIYEYLIANVEYSIGIVDNFEIDKINILQASKLAMRICLEKLSSKPNALLIDGNFKINSNFEEFPIVKGDRKSLSIAAASIIAKVTRDKLMEEKYQLLYPAYNFAQNKGYGTALHRKAILQFGICPIHRKTFLKNLLNEQPELFRNEIN